MLKQFKKKTNNNFISQNKTLEERMALFDIFADLLNVWLM